MTITLDLSTIGKTTLKGIRRQLSLELSANNSGQKNNPSDNMAAYRSQLRREETQLVSAIAKLNSAIES